MLILGIETSCDDTASAVVRDGREILSNVVNSQVEVHAKYGGVVPELASRNHLMNMNPVMESALENAGILLGDIDGIAVTVGPGLIGSLLVGLQTAKGIAYSLGKPLAGVNHIHAHVTAIFACDAAGNDFARGASGRAPRFPYIALAVSGGHTSLYRVNSFDSMIRIGKTLDDAAGEALDKVANLLNLPYPGGVSIDRISQNGRADAVKFPRALIGSGALDFSFSGLKTAARNFLLGLDVKNAGLKPDTVADIAASFQEAVVDVLVEKTVAAAERENIEDIVIAGGVASNSRLREKMPEAAGSRRMEVHLTPLKLCTDNAAMVAALGYYRLKASDFVFDMDKVISMDARAESND